MNSSSSTGATSGTPQHPLVAANAARPGGAAGETGRLLLSTDWAATPLGPMEQWPQALRIAVSICLNSRFPMFVWWGPHAIDIYNDAYIPMLGKRHPEAFGGRASETWADIWDIVGEQRRVVMETGEPTWNERVLLVMERNGFPEDTWFTWSYSPIHDDGSIGGMFCAVTEETGRVLAERERDRLISEAQDAARTLRTWFDNAPGFVALLRGPDFVFELVNRAYYNLVGLRGGLEGRRVFEAIPEVANQGYFELLRGVYSTGEPFVGRGMQVFLQPVAGSAPVERFVDLVYQPVRDAGGAVVGIFVQGHDVTDQVHATTALEDANRLKDEFLATLAHELRNPLAPIRQAAGLARSGADAERRDWALQVIERQASHMALLLDDLLDVSRISRGKLQLRLEDVDLKSVVDAAVETAWPLVESRKHRLEVQLPDHPVRLHVDRLRIAQVLSNLLSNAAKYTDAGGRIQLVAEVHAGELQLHVRDNGIGLTPESIEEIFGMFSQVESAAERAHGGLGIGLALSRGLAQLHGGSLRAQSEGPGRGSEFTVTLPLPARAAEPAASEQDSATPRERSRSRRILIADDNADALMTMTMLLEMEGHEVHGAADGEQALAQAEALRPDVVILDIGMPRLSGHEVAARIRATDWGGKVLLIALTGWGQAHDQERARLAGFDRHCTKPVDLAELLGILDGA